MNSDCYKMMAALAECHVFLRDHAASVRSLSCVKSVTHWSELSPTGDGGVRFENFVDAELLDGRAISWNMEITITVDFVTIEADIREIGDSGDRVLRTIPSCTHVELTKGADAAVNVARELCDGYSWHTK